MAGISKDSNCRLGGFLGYVPGICWKLLRDLRRFPVMGSQRYIPLSKPRKTPRNKAFLKGMKPMIVPQQSAISWGFRWIWGVVGPLDSHDPALRCNGWWFYSGWRGSIGGKRYTMLRTQKYGPTLTTKYFLTNNWSQLNTRGTSTPWRKIPA